jgi:hypothetical protein
MPRYSIMNNDTAGRDNVMKINSRTVALLTIIKGIEDGLLRQVVLI